jgi:hypothetical protein
MMAAEPGFQRGSVGLLVTLGVVFAAAFTLLSAYGPDFRPGGDGGAHALSPAATGFSALVALGNAAGLPGRIGRNEAAARAAGLLILTPDRNSAPGDIAAIIRNRRGAPVLLVLPKWRTVRKPLEPAFVEALGTEPPIDAVRGLRGLDLRPVLSQGAVRAGTVLRDSERRGIAEVAPANIRSLASGGGFDPFLADAAGNMVIGWNAQYNLYVLADPDLLNNKGLRQLAPARAAVRIVAALGGERPGGPVYDVTLNGFGSGRSVLRTALQPPFVALTVALLIAGGLAFWHGLMRFGVPEPVPRAIAFGKLALVNNVTSLIRMAGREVAVAPRYAALVGDSVAARLRAPAGLDPAATTAWLEQHAPGYAALAEAAAAAEGRDEVFASARALYRWQEKFP